jgi:hypothetical protein
MAFPAGKKLTPEVSKFQYLKISPVSFNDIPIPFLWGKTPLLYRSSILLRILKNVFRINPLLALPAG